MWDLLQAKQVKKYYAFPVVNGYALQLFKLHILEYKISVPY